MGPYRSFSSWTSQGATMKVLIILSVAALASCEADADALYSSYYGGAGPAALGYPYAYAKGYSAARPAVRTIPAPAPVAAVRTVSAPAVAAVAAVAAVRTVSAPAVAAVRSAVASVISSQYHAQDEDKNYSFGYSNINSARQESGNAYTGVVGSYSDGVRTYNYVADGLGFRHV